VGVIHDGAVKAWDIEVDGDDERDDDERGGNADNRDAAVEGKQM